MAVKRHLKLNEVYIIQEVLLPLCRQELVGYKCKPMLQQADDHLPRHFLSCEAVVLGGPQAGHRVLLQGVRLRRDLNQRERCSCKAYPFPHRKGGGDCYATTTEPFFCGTCGKPCDWLGEGNQVSTCCEGPLFHDPELKVQITED